MRDDAVTPKQRETILLRIAEGETLRAICEDADMPARSTVQKLRVHDGDFADQYARAREAQADHFADELVEIADTEADPNRARVRIDARKWKAAKMAPKAYGEKVEHDHGGLTISIAAGDADL